MNHMETPNFYTKIRVIYQGKSDEALNKQITYTVSDYTSFYSSSIVSKPCVETYDETTELVFMLSKPLQFDEINFITEAIEIELENVQAHYEKFNISLN